MTTHLDPRRAELLVRLMALAARLEREGQYNVAKLARAGADALARQAAYGRELPSDPAVLAAECAWMADELATFGVSDGLAAAFRLAAPAVAEERFTLADETPDPFVCRTCGGVALGEPPARCSVCGAWAETFQRWLPVYWLNALDPLEAMALLERTPQTVVAMMDGLPEEALAHEPGPGAWSLRNAATHLRDAQGVLVYRLGLMLEQDDPELAAQAVFAWAQEGAPADVTTADVLAEYLSARRALLDRLGMLSLRDWHRTGRHQEFGRVTIRQQVSYFAAHEPTHLAQMEALARAAHGQPSRNP